MCITLPARVVAVSGHQAEVEISGKNSIVRIGAAEAILPGDWVLSTNDFLIKKINSEEAREIFDLLGLYPRINKENLDDDLKNILAAAGKRTLKKTEIEYLLGLQDENSQAALYAEANVTRKSNIKDHICIHGIIEFSSYCRNNCHYCGLRCDNDEITRYRMTPAEIIEAAVKAAENGYKIIVLQSGEDNWYDEGKLFDIVKKIKERSRVFIYLSIGDRPLSIYENLKKAGANGVLYRFETANPEIFTRLRPGKILSERIVALKEMKKMGYVISTGSLVGLPGQTISDLADDILLMKELDAFMPSFGPLVPSENTPLKKEKIIDFDLILKMIAVCRLVMPKSRIAVTTAMETLGPKDSRQQAFMSGANSVMLNLTPEKYRQDYRIYDHKFFDAEKKYEKWALFKGELSYQMLEEEVGVKI